MPKLILDLDLTVFTNEYDFNKVHLSHELSSAFETKLRDTDCFIWFINPIDLSALIEIACVDYDGVIILTAGTWHESIRDVMANNLPLSHKSAEMLRNCLHLTPLTCQKNFPTLSLTEISHLSKNCRFNKYLEQDANLKAQQFVFLDDNLHHIYSFSQSEQVCPVYANTREEGLAFYQEAVTALAQAHIKEQSNHQRSVSPPGSSISSASNLSYSPLLFSHHSSSNPTVQITQTAASNTKEAINTLKNYQCSL